jgi:glycosyltransferase involved in cell wall biosynthesis
VSARQGSRSEPQASGGHRAGHLALFIRSLGSRGAGAERIWLHLGEAFAARGHRVDLVLGRRTGHLADAVPPGVRVVDLAVRSTLPLIGAALRDPRSARSLAPALVALPPPWILAAVPALAAYLERERPDALLSALSYSNLAALWARERADVPVRVAVSEHNTLSVRAAHARRRRWRVLPLLESRWYPRADAILAVSTGVADDLARTAGLPRERIVVTYNPVVSDAIRVAAREPVAHAWLAPGAAPVVLGVGKLAPQKGFDTLLRAFARVRAQRPARLAILGEGPQRRALEQLAGELGIAADVALPGFVANPFAWMARSAVFALSSRWEGLPGALIEALACGCAVVSTDCPSGPAEILEGGRLGPLVPVEDDEALGAAIARALSDPSDPAPRRARAEDFSLDRVAPRYLAALLPAATVATNAASRSATAG